MRKRSRNAKNKKCIVGYFASFFSHFAPGWHSHEKSKDFVVYFFVALIIHEVRLKYEKFIVSVSYFVVFLQKHTQNINEMRNTKSV